MTVTMTMEEYLEFRQVKENLEMCINAARYCEEKQQSQYQQQNNKDYLIHCIANQSWDDIYYEFNNKPQS